MNRLRAAFLASVLTATAVACGVLPSPRAPTGCGFPDDATLAYSGRTTLRRLGLSEDLPAADLPAMVYVTAEPIPFRGSIPNGAELPPDYRAWCAIYDDGAPMLTALGGVPIDWSPPD